MLKGLLRKHLSIFLRHLAFGELPGDHIIVSGIDNNQHRGKIFRRSPDHGRAAYIDIFQCIFQRYIVF